MQKLENHIVAWAESHTNIRAILVVGSRARRDPLGDEWSDLDLMIFSTGFEEYLFRTDWLDDIGDVWVSIPHETSAGDPERLVLFDGGYNVDFVFFTIDELRRLTNAETLDGVYQRGYYVLVDKDGLAGQIFPPSFKPPPFGKPSENAFLSTVDTFWYGAVYVAKQIRRRNLWVVKFRDWSMKELLLKMMEWHAHTTHGWDHDTFHDGHFLLNWTDRKTWNALNDVFGHFGAADSWRALLASTDLFRRIATETASRLGYSYPNTLDENITQYIKTLLAEDGSSGRS